MGRQDDLRSQQGSDPDLGSGYSPNILVVPNSVPAKTVPGLVAYAKAHAADKLTFAPAGVGTGRRTVQGDVTCRHHPCALPWGGVGDHRPAGRARDHVLRRHRAAHPAGEGRQGAGLAVTSEKRFPTVPELPTMIEAGYPGFIAVLSMGLMAPAGTPAAVVEQIHQACVKVLSMPEVRTKLTGTGMEVLGNSPAEFKAANRCRAAAMGEDLQGGRHHAGTLVRTLKILNKCAVNEVVTRA